MLNKHHATLLVELIQAKVLLGEKPYENPIEGMATWAVQIGRDTIDNIERFSDFMEWNDLKRNDLRERIRTGLYMDYHYKHPTGLGSVIPAEAALWALMTTEIIIEAIGAVMRLYSNLLE